MKRIHTKSIFTQCHLSPQTHTHTQRNISFCLQVDILQRSYNCSVTEDQSLTEHQEPLAVHLWADIPAFQLKIQPKTALVSHQKIRNRTLNNGYYSDTGFRPLSLWSHSELVFSFHAYMRKRARFWEKIRCVCMCVPHENVSSFVSLSLIQGHCCWQKRTHSKFSVQFTSHTHKHTLFYKE